MLKIINFKKLKGSVCQYNLFINNDYICSFEHDRAKGLANCLKCAAEKVKEINLEELYKLQNLIGKDE